MGVAETVEKMEAQGLKVADWVKEMLDSGFETFYAVKDGRRHYYDISQKDYLPIPERPNVILIRDLKAAGREIEANPSASLIDMGDGVLLLEFHSKMNTLDRGVMDMWRRSLERLNSEPEWVGMVIGSQAENFCVGADLSDTSTGIEERVDEMQQMVMATRYSKKPVVTAPYGRVLGGGAEVAMSGARMVASAETYMGQVEVGVGLVPAGGGCKELLRRVVTPVMRFENVDPLPFVGHVFQVIALAKVSESAHMARKLGFLTEADRIVVNPDQVIAEAKREALNLAPTYRPPIRRKNIYVLGEPGKAALRSLVYGLVQAGWATEYEAFLAERIANIICGGPLTGPQWVDEQVILDLEKEAFLELIQQPKTLERIMHMLQTGKPLRN